MNWRSKKDSFFARYVCNRRPCRSIRVLRCLRSVSCVGIGLDSREGRVLGLSPEDVVEALVESPAGVIVACNIAHGISERLIAWHFARNILEWVGRLMVHEGRNQPEDLVGAIEAVRDRCYPTKMQGRANAPDFRAKGCHSTTDEDMNAEMSCVVAASIFRQWIHPTDVERLRREGLTFPASGGGSMVSEIIDHWRVRSPDDRRVRFNPDASLGRPGMVAWFTRRDCLAEAQGQADRHAAQRARDALGLVHCGEGVVLGALHIPAKLLRSVGFSRPTFADAGSHVRFKTWPDGKRARKNRAWGFTADLAKVANGEVCVDGCAERITRSISGACLARHGPFEIELLGAVANATDTGPGADHAFAKRLRGTLTAQELASKLRRLLREPEVRNDRGS